MLAVGVVGGRDFKCGEEEFKETRANYETCATTKEHVIDIILTSVHFQRFVEFSNICFETTV